MKILIIACPERYKICKNTTYSDIITYYKNNSCHNVTIIFGDEHNSYNLTEQNKPNIVIFFDIDAIRYAKYFKELFRPDIHTMSCTTDLYYISGVNRCEMMSRLNTICTFSLGTKLLTTYIQRYPEQKIKALGARYINTNIYKNYNLPKKYDILIYATRKHINNLEEQYADECYKEDYFKHTGNTLPNPYHYYPLRAKIENLLNKNSHKYRLKILPDMGSLNAIQYVNEGLSKLINESYLTLACCSRTDLLYDKYLEIACSQSCILSNIPSDYTDVFTNNIAYVNEWMSDDEILSVIDNELADKQALSEKTERMANICRTNYNLQKMQQRMDELIDEVC